MILRHTVRFLFIVILLGGFMFVASQLSENKALIYPKLLYAPITDTDSELDLNHLEWGKTIPGEPAFFLKASVRLPPDLLLRDLQMNIDLIGSYELYWNGELQGKNGSYSPLPRDEIPGYSYASFIIPADRVASSDNVIFMKVSHHQQNNFRANPRLAFGEFVKVSRNVLINSILVHFLAGVFFIVAIYFALLYFISYRKASFILFSALCMAGFLLILIGFSKVYLPIPYDWYELRFWVFLLISFAVALGTPVFLLYHFDVPHRKIFILVLSVLSIIAWMLPSQFNWAALLIGFGAQFAISLWALARQKPGSIEVLVGQLTFVIGFIYFNISIYLGFSILVIAILFSLSLSFREERRRFEATEIRSARLRAELLRKNIQPHFLMNTLTTIISLIETDPKASISLIETLSDEFSTLSEIVDCKLIQLSQELDLCRSYLKVMAIRNDISYNLLEKDCHTEMDIPPAIIHTLIENGLSHNAPRNGKMDFEVSAKATSKSLLIEVTSHGRVQAKESTINSEGTGLKYIKARLEESFPDRWTLKQECTEHFWKTRILIEES